MTPPAGRLNGLEGYASLKVETEAERARSKFSFFLDLDGRGRVDVFDPLGRTVYVLYFEEETAYLVPSGADVYWQGGRDEIIEKFLGFDFTLHELTSLLSGVWDPKNSGPPLSPASPIPTEGGWRLVRDKKERIVSGSKGDLSFEVKDYFPGSRSPHSLLFQASQSKGSLKVLSLRINPPLKTEVLGRDFLRTHVRKTWEEILGLLEKT